MSLRKGDMVMVIAGREKGKIGKILSLNREKGLVMVEKLNFVKRHQKPTQKQKQGGIVEKEAPLAISNVMYYDEKQGKPTRLGVRVAKDGSKVRIAKRSGVEISASSK